MSRDKAPDNMPTGVIKTYIEHSETEAHRWSIAKVEAYKSLERAIQMEAYHNDFVTEYKGWLWIRENEDTHLG